MEGDVKSVGSCACGSPNLPGWVHGRKCYPGWHREFGDGKQGLWIKVSERLPEIGVPVLVVWRGMVDVCAWHRDGWSFGGPSPTHWMPLPKPPTEYAKRRVE
jgi:hypothetical protein